MGRIKMRTIRVNGFKCDVSKSEAEFISAIAGNKHFDKQKVMVDWCQNAPTEQAKLRRKVVLNAQFGPLVIA